MTVALNLSAVYSAASGGGVNCRQPFIQCTDGSVLTAFTHSTNAESFTIIKSTDSGENWTSKLTVTLGRDTLIAGFAHLPTNVALFAVSRVRDPDHVAGTYRARIYRSTDAGDNWSLEKNWDAEGGATPSLAQLRGITSYTRNAVFVAGQLPPASETARRVISFGTNFGTSWSTPIFLDTGGSANFCEATCNANGGVFLAETIGAHVWKTTNYGGSWSDLGALPDTSSPAFGVVNSLVALTPSVIVASGTRGSGSGAAQVGLWRSTDTGSSFTRLTNSVFTDYPTSTSGTLLTGIRRLTRDACIASCGANWPSGTSPWRISLDQAQSFNHVVTHDGATFSSTAACTSPAYPLRNGWILAWANTGTTNMLFRGRLTC